MLAAPASAQQQGPDALSRVFKHNNGQTTHTQKMGGSNQIREMVYDKNKVLCAQRLFTLDSQGRILNGRIADGKNTPIGSTVNTFDPQTGQMLQETLYNAKGQPVRLLFYPGALKDPKYSKRMVAFNLDPGAPKAAPREVQGRVQPIVPVTKDEDEFEPGLPQGTAAPKPGELPPTRGGAPTQTMPLPVNGAPAKRGWLRQKKN